MKNNILVVGGTGFIGYHLLKYLKKKDKLFSISKNKPSKKRKVRDVNYIFLKDFRYAIYKKIMVLE